MLIAVDIETRDDGLRVGMGPGWPFGLGFVTGVAIVWEDGKQEYLSYAHADTENADHTPRLRELFARRDARFVFHNAGYDLAWLDSQFNTGWPEHIEDTSALASIVDENRLEYGLDALARDYGLPGKDERELNDAASRLNIKKAKEEMDKIPARFVAGYALQDAKTTLDLFKILYAKAEEEETVSAYRLEMDLLPMIYKMRRRGIRVDTPAAQKAVETFSRGRDEALAALAHKLCLPSVAMTDIRSPQWLVKIFEQEGLSYPKTEKGNPSFQAAFMSGHTHEFPQLITRAKKLNDAAEKFMSTYILGFTHKGRVHPVINQFLSEGGGTRSHRFSYSAPPLQQAPARQGEFASTFRGVFLPEEDCVWAAIDYSQQEFRLMVHYAEKVNAKGALDAGNAYRGDPNTDFHSFVAELTGLPRKRAKDVNFAVAFSAGVRQMALMSGMSIEEAKMALQQYNQRMPFIKELSQRAVSSVKRNGFIRLIDGAVCHFPFWECEDYNTQGIASSEKEARARWPGMPLQRAYLHKALNRLIQGSAARMTKKAMLDCYRAGILPLISIHDELGFSVRTEEEAQEAALIMREAIPLTIPVLTDIEYGWTWGHSMENKGVWLKKDFTFQKKGAIV